MPTSLRPVRRKLAGALLLLLGLVAAIGVVSLTTFVARAATNVSPDADSSSAAQLIEQLGSDHYYFRRRAEQQLIERGAGVIDLLRQAEEHSDLEIAARAGYILQRIRIEWIHPGDSAEVQTALHRYGDLSDAQRVERMDQLAALADDGGLGALCRIARFEPSPQMARYSALKVMQSDAPPQRVASGVTVMKKELGDSRRVPVQWLRTYAEQLEQPEQVFHRWLTLIDEETARYTNDSAETKVLIVIRILAFHLDLCRKCPQQEHILSNLSRRIELFSQSDEAQQLLRTALSMYLRYAEAPNMTRAELKNLLGPATVAGWLIQNDARETFGLAYAMNWLWENEQWDALALLEDAFEDQIQSQRLLVYIAAAARWKQGRNELAEEFAQRARDMVADDAGMRGTIGDLIGEMGRHDWAEREWWSVVDTLSVLDIKSMSARQSLAILRLHDQGEDREAAELLEEVCDAADADPKLKRNIMRDQTGRFVMNQSYTLRDYYLACQAATVGNYELQRKHLEAAYRHNQMDPDILISMYRSSSADKAYREKTSGRIRETAKSVQEKIERQPDYAQWYNHWAWLVSNTEGDYDQAVKYSLRSLELSPGSPSYLDTLGRCYYAVGDLEKALATQREAVQLHPHLKVMRDQLALFEAAQAAAQTEKD